MVFHKISGGSPLGGQGQQFRIDRLPLRRTENQPKEPMNCASCRRRKVKCNRLKPSCDECQLFSYPCIYDAVPRKRGPKSVVAPARLKRCRKTRPRHQSNRARDKTVAFTSRESDVEAMSSFSSPGTDQLGTEMPNELETSLSWSASILELREEKNVHEGFLIENYFQQVHGKPYHILDEISTRQAFMSNQLAQHLRLAICAVSARCISTQGADDHMALTAEDYAQLAIAELDVDELSIERIQTLLLLSQSVLKEGVGKEAYMYLSSAIAIALALNLHLELPAEAQSTLAERECRRRLFWSCYLMDRFAACGTKRPLLISDDCIQLGLPTDSTGHATVGFQVEQDRIGCSSWESCNILVGVTRILGVTHRYLASGVTDNISDLPLQAPTTISEIQEELDVWSAGAQDVFSSIEALFEKSNSAVFVMGKLIYHLVYCLIYRPFLPLQLAELEANHGVQWQREVTELCFLHANAITELVDIGSSYGMNQWPSFVSYCISTAGTVHIHGSHYHEQSNNLYAMSGEFFSRDLQQLARFANIWGGTTHQKDGLHALYSAHSKLIKSLKANSMRLSPSVLIDPFYGRYRHDHIEGTHFKLNELFHKGQTLHDRMPSVEDQTEFSPSILQDLFSEQWDDDRLVPETPALDSSPTTSDDSWQSELPVLAPYGPADLEAIADDDVLAKDAQQFYLNLLEAQSPDEFTAVVYDHAVPTFNNSALSPVNFAGLLQDERSNMWEGVACVV